MFQWLKALTRRDYNLSVSQLRTLVYGPPTLSGVAISEEIAMGITAVLRAVTLISETIAGLDSHVYQYVPGKGKSIQRRHPVSLLLKDPNDRLNAAKFWAAIVLHTICSGNGFAEIERLTDDTPVGLHLIHWRNVRIEENEQGELLYYLIREGRYVKANDMLHLTAVSWDGVIGISPIRAARESLGLGVAAERYAASVYGNGAVPRGFLKVTGVPSPDTKGNIREAWETIYGGLSQSNRIGILGGDTEFVSTNMTPEDCQLLLSRAFQIQEVCRIFGVPENLLFSGTQSYNADQEGNAQFYQLGLKNLIEKIEAELDFKLITREQRFLGYHVKYDVRDFKAGFEQDVNSCSRAVLTGLMTPNEGRERLGLNPMEGGDSLLAPLNMAILDGEDDKTTNDLTKIGEKENSLQLTDQRVIRQNDPIPEPVKEATRLALEDQIGRAIRRQAKSKPKPLEMAGYLHDALTPSYRAFAVAHEVDQPIEEFVRRWVSLTETREAKSLTMEEVLCLINC